MPKYLIFTVPVSAGCAFGGGEPSLSLLPEIQALLTRVFGTADHLIPTVDREAIGDALRRADPAGKPRRCVACAGVDHGFICEAHSAIYPQASAQGWRLLLAGDAVA